MNGCEVRVTFEGNASPVLGRIATELEKLGYTPKSQDADGLTMAFAGKWFTANCDEVRHSVTVVATTGQLAFTFGTGWIASTWSEADVAWAQARADQVVANASA